ncbi:cysteinyl leukotriene receptor 1-like [Chiloscyllium plagiosum]|uniref:cysteinyl leukotriene receptor 1-like n=1 Tax=Chiloscyllium plagiosum TaxID=36176 RepID=UPI001CB7D917|nr:cysteinyl leukotriene receptor 1-like [Chiloscyllium plagiosum]XP_043538058.1 cysteinyl leukotriene receptor 1-like [Chiloscyllium plagiosum]
MVWTSKTPNCSNEEFKFPVFVRAYSTILILGFIGNTVALYVFVKLTQRKTASTVFMINLAVSDLFFTLTLPYRIIYYVQREWRLGAFLCRITTYAFYVNLYSSIFFLTALSIFRYISILHPIWSRSVVTVRRSLWVTIGIWLFIGLVSVPFLLVSSKCVNGTCRCFEPSNVSWSQIQRMNYFAFVVGFLLPFLTILACYTRILQRLMGSAGTMRVNARSRRKSTYMIIIVMSSFLFCFLPYHVIRTIHLHIMSDGVCHDTVWFVQRAVVVTICLAAANSCLNPVLYYFVGENFQSTLKTSTILKSRSASSGSVVFVDHSPATVPPSSNEQEPLSGTRQEQK